jgi:hypothetical protein
VSDFPLNDAALGDVGELLEVYDIMEMAPFF